MAPRKAASAGEDDQCPTLKLIMEKGPLLGQTNDFRPETRIQIGRTVRGNTLSIKDAGISTNHLLIQVKPVTGGRRCWTITDLKSSNGTFLNGERLKPSEPAALSDGDVIIVGEKTSIKVRFEVSAGEIEVNTRKNARRGVRKQVEELGIIDEDPELGLGVQNLESENNMRRGLRSEKYMDLESEGGKLGAVDEEKERGRRTRGSKARDLENGNKEEIESKGKVSLRRTRSSKKDENEENLILDLDEDEDKNDKVAEVEVKQERNVVTRRTRSAKNNENLSKDLSVDEDKKLEPSEVKGNGRVSVRRTRSSRKEKNIDDPVVDLSVIERKRTRKGTRGRKNLDAETPLVEKENEESNLEEQKVCEEEKRVSKDGVDKFVNRVTSERENATEFASTSRVKENAFGIGSREVVADLEKMTLGEWFEFLEVYLPKQIIDETEEMISEMRQKAERLHEFVLQQKNGTGNGDAALDEKLD